MQDYEQTFEEFWRPLVTNPDGSLDEDKVKRELGDYHFLLEEVPKVYVEVTGSRISKPNTLASEVISQYHEDLMRWQAEVEREVHAGARELGAHAPEAGERTVDARGASSRGS